MESIQTTENFNKIIQSDQPVIIKFEAGWCPDCKAMDLWIDPIIEKYNAYQWYSVNRDELEDVAANHDVMGIPSLLIFKNSEKLAHLHSANAKSPEQVETFLAETFQA
ncbi:thioredoxin family protein [Staphylococcus lugdunensis]|uniref:Thioredoxin n=1 Tax=Staphylococcus lugdunensis TaxID=28035 RepID=A0A4Q9WCI7_STALU|nr:MULTISPECIES: thioredoxin family protein [Staphylococcus]AMG61202.1 thioredoxin [Staphylococcus lugdunensis]ARJ12018.1 thiol reductase thioredoxin [Staphylococcus lugdunensis]ARJ14522.1 thiol reductase thioredoxin [Staphylococcus lugdunensis]AST59531.1 thioredoxin [Staphylococcus lugdunensis]ATG69442.1 thioredoxin [Staphylococcus lugdunensis]